MNYIWDINQHEIVPTYVIFMNVNGILMGY